jgi:catechol 2,3-dioxygenase-like lactoylglutathione lyase family enzyme
VNWRAITGFRLVVADLDGATGFYQALGFAVGERNPIADGELALLGVGGSAIRQSLTLGPSRLDLDCFAPGGQPYPPEADAASLCFQHLALVTSDAESAWSSARRAGAAPISRDGPVTLPAASGGVTAVKFRDPEGHPLEFLQIPNAAAQGWPGQGLLGIDHSAVSVSDVAASLRFYGARGLRAGAASLNRGDTQVALDGLDAVEVDVRPLLPPSGPAHLELLGYRRPRGRSWGPVAINDIAATRIVWQAERAGLERDPDGHWQQLA